MEEQEFSPLVRAVGVIDENRNFIPYGSTMVAKGLPLFFFKTKEEYDQHAPTLPEPCAVITLDDIDTGGFEFDAAIDPESENAVQNKVIAAALEALRDKANFDRPGMVQFTDSTTVTDRNSGLGLSAIEKNHTIGGSLANRIKIIEDSLEWKHVTVSKVFPDPGGEMEITVPDIAGSREIVAEIGVGGAPELYRTLFLQNGILSGAYMDRARAQIATVYVVASFGNGTIRLGTYEKNNLDVQLFSLFYR